MGAMPNLKRYWVVAVTWIALMDAWILMDFIGWQSTTILQPALPILEKARRLFINKWMVKNQRRFLFAV